MLSKAIREKDRLNLIRYYLALTNNQAAYTYYFFPIDPYMFFAYSGEVNIEWVEQIGTECDKYYRSKYYEFVKIISKGDDPDGRLHVFDMEYILDICKEILSAIMLSGTDGVHTIITWDERKKAFVTHLTSTSLLSCLYVELQFMITQNRTIRRCAHKTCDNYFEIYKDDKRKIYCSDGCRHAAATSKYRERQKQIEEEKKCQEKQE